MNISDKSVIGHRNITTYNNSYYVTVLHIRYSTYFTVGGAYIIFVYCIQVIDRQNIEYLTINFILKCIH